MCKQIITYHVHKVYHKQALQQSSSLYEQQNGYVVNLTLLCSAVFV
jgi:hypothetical protein